LPVSFSFAAGAAAGGGTGAAGGGGTGALGALGAAGILGRGFNEGGGTMGPPLLSPKAEMAIVGSSRSMPESSGSALPVVSRSMLIDGLDVSVGVLMSGASAGTGGSMSSSALTDFTWRHSLSP